MSDARGNPIATSLDADHGVRFPISELRQTLTLNRFKALLLGNDHLPGEPQTALVKPAIWDAGMQDHLDVRTWASWFAKNPRRAKPSKFDVLDCIARGTFFSADGAAQTYAYFRDLGFGGLVGRLLAPTKSSHPRQVLKARAAEYTPRSALHLHLDAIEVAALAEANGNVSWQRIKRISADRVLELIHARWAPRCGLVYADLASRARVADRPSNDEHNDAVPAANTRWKPDLDSFLNAQGALPDWSRIPVDHEIGAEQSHRLLFAIAADPDFLVGDRLEQWSLDLASAALARSARVGADNEFSLGGIVPKDAHYWRAFAMLLFETAPDDELEDALAVAMEVAGGQWTAQSLAAFIRGREEYHRHLAQLGVSAQTVLAFAERGERLHPMGYRHLAACAP